MEENTKNLDDISVYIEDREYTANKYVLRCFSVTMLIYTISFVLNILNIFIVDQDIMWKGYVPSLILYLLVHLISKKISLSDERTKYFILSNIMIVYTILGMSLTYHVVLVSLLPFLYATLYSSKHVIKYIYVTAVISTIIVVYGGYFGGLCDANMVLLTTKRMEDCINNGHFILTQINSNPYATLMLYFVVPRCLIYVAYASVFSNIYNIVSGSLEKAKLTVELEKAKEAAESANQAKSQFLARMSHEIRTPINSVLGMNEMILRESEEPETRKYAKDIKSSANELLDIINEILDSSKIESGKMEIICVSYNMSSMLNDLYNMIKVKAEEKNLELIFDVDSSIPCGYLGDDKRIKQIIINLLTNAVKYTNQGSVTLRITAETEGENAILHYSIIDTGIGIKEEDFGRIYDAFQRIDMSRNRYVEGTGLGMNIVQQLLSLMESELHIASEYEKGSTFSFDLIQKITNEEPLGDFQERIERAGEENVDRVYYTAADAKILVVDDNKINLVVFKGLLKRTNMLIYEAESGKECLELLKQHNFHMVFLDHMMPEMDGIETLHAIKENQLCENTPIIMLTANALVGEREKYLEEGFDDFLAKPIIPEKLDKMVLKYLPDYLVMQEVSMEHKIHRNEENISFVSEEISMETGIANAGSEGLYYSLLGDFYLMIDMKITKINRCISENRIKDYIIEVHALKSASRLIGAAGLGDEFYELERLGNEGDIERIKEKTPAILKHFEGFKTILKEYVQYAEQDKQEVGISVLLETLENMKSAVNHSDAGKIEGIMKHLDNYRFPQECFDELEKLRIHVAALSMEDIRTSCDNIGEKLQK